ncbi:MAG: hypothetical protein KGI53_05730 [Nitrospirota bacterium]|nr:hypothetical protein [Nitrospirota bacterium]
MQPEERPAGRKKPYAPPTILEYGSVAKLTEKKSGSIPDGKSGMAMSHGKGGKGGPSPSMGKGLGLGLGDD